MANAHRRYEIRCPVHGFISISDWEREIIAQPAEESSRTSAYKLLNPDIIVVTEDDLRRVRPLSHYSSVVGNLHDHPIEIVRLYARPESADAARAKVATFLEGSTT